MSKKVRRVKPKKNGDDKKENEGMTQSGGSGPDFRKEYAYVIKDLRRVFILAAVMFVLLIGINLFFQFWPI